MSAWRNVIALTWSNNFQRCDVVKAQNIYSRKNANLKDADSPDVFTVGAKSV